METQTCFRDSERIVASTAFRVEGLGNSGSKDLSNGVLGTRDQIPSIVFGP